MPAYSAKDNALAVKLVTVFPENSEQGQLPAIMANVMVFDSKNGLLKAVSFFFSFFIKRILFNDVARPLLFFLQL